MKDLRVYERRTGELIGSFERTSAEEIHRRVRAAQVGFEMWSTLTIDERTAILAALADEIERRQSDLIRFVVGETGKEHASATREVESALSAFRWLTDRARYLGGIMPSDQRDGTVAWVEWRPVGVVAAITPSNAPVSALLWKLGGALAAGCTVVAKPSPYAPMSANLIADCVPSEYRSIFSLVLGDEREAIELVEDPIVRHVSFSGSFVAGTRVAAAASKTAKRLTLELGGNSAAVVAKDGDIERVARDIARQAFRDAGQYCYRINRVFAVAEIYEELRDALCRAAGDHAGGMFLPATPMQVDVVREQVRDAVDSGARVVMGEWVGAEYPEARWSPTVIECQSVSTRLMLEETFGPVVTITRVSDLDEAVSLANSSGHGLAAYLFGGATAPLLRAATRLVAGSIWINDVFSPPRQFPFGGTGLSGYGREKSEWGITEFMYLCSTYLSIQDT